LVSNPSWFSYVSPISQLGCLSRPLIENIQPFPFLSSNTFIFCGPIIAPPPYHPPHGRQPFSSRKCTFFSGAARIESKSQPPADRKNTNDQRGA
jgi:hypothetical protein